VLLVVPLLILFSSPVQPIAWVVSCSQLIFGLGILFWFRGGLSFRGPLVAESKLDPRGFSWLNLSVFLLVNIFVLLPLIGVYLFFCASLAIDHFSEGFLALRPGGFTVQ